MRSILCTVTFVTMAGVALLATVGDSGAVEPGVDIAAPRVAITSANGTTLRFEPSIVLVEQGDYVRWTWTTGLHTTTSGSPCVANMLWNSNLNSTTTQFTRQFLEAPGTLPFFCSPHCGLGMTGQIAVTSPIQLATVDSSGATLLSWTGGGGSYRIFRSNSPLFGAGTTVLSPGTGTSQTSFLDSTGAPPAVDKAIFYLVMNQF